MQHNYSYKRMKSVVHNLVHSFFSYMNQGGENYIYMEDLVFDSMKMNRINRLVISFSDRALSPHLDEATEIEILSSVNAYMDEFPQQALSQNVDCSKLSNIEAVVNRDGNSFNVCSTAIDDRGKEYNFKVYSWDNHVSFDLRKYRESKESITN